MTALICLCPYCRQILNIPDEMRENGVGPLISAKAVDEDIIWDRLDQMRNACEIVRAPILVLILILPHLMSGGHESQHCQC